MQAGNIRATDMFQQLLVADIVISRYPIHNANVFYELANPASSRCNPSGSFLWRRALRAGRTRVSVGPCDEVPFDLSRLDRYLNTTPDVGEKLEILTTRCRRELSQS